MPKMSEKQMKAVLASWEWTPENIRAMREDPGLEEVLEWKRQVNEDIRNMTPKERAAYFEEGLPEDYQPVEHPHINIREHLTPGEIRKYSRYLDN